MGATIHQANPKRAMEKFDCIVIGGGPAGSTAAALVAQAGLRTLLLEREQFPRFQVGGSLMPESYWTLQRLGVLPQLKASRYPCKASVQFVSHTGEELPPFYFHEADPRECSQTWQVLRSEFDQLLFENAREHGADGRLGCRVIDVLFEGGQAMGVVARVAGDEQPRTIQGDVIIDATGRQALIASNLGLRQEVTQWRKATIWAYPRGGRRDAGINAGATVILKAANRRSWFWYVPLADDLVSVGLVADTDYLFSGRGKPESVFEEELCHCPAVLQRLMNAELVSDFRVLKDFSYVAQETAGDGWVLVGDALGFVDPLFASGGYLAMKSAEMAADCVIAGLQQGDLSAAQMGAWAGEFQQGVHWMRKLAESFYHDGFCVEEFLRDYPQHRLHLTNLLAGKVFDEDAGLLFEDLDPWLAARQPANGHAALQDHPAWHTPAASRGSNLPLN